MLRVNSHTTWRVRQLMRRWMRETGLDAEAPASELDGIETDDVWWLAGRLYRWLTSPARKLPTGVTLAQLAGDGLAEYEDCADLSLGAFGAQAENRGARFGFARTAAHGGLACKHWWGHPRWPAQVERFMEALDDPADKHWSLGGQYRAALPAEPVDVADRAPPPPAPAVTAMGAERRLGRVAGRRRHQVHKGCRLTKGFLGRLLQGPGAQGTTHLAWSLSHSKVKFITILNGLLLHLIRQLQPHVKDSQPKVEFAVNSASNFGKTAETSPQLDVGLVLPRD
jgi:hypothetical protein